MEGKKNAILLDKRKLEEHLPIVVKEQKKLWSGDFEVHTKKVKFIQILQIATDWFIDFRAKVITYGILIYYLYIQYTQKVLIWAIILKF